MYIVREDLSQHNSKQLERFPVEPVDHATYKDFLSKLYPDHIIPDVVIDEMYDNKVIIAFNPQLSFPVKHCGFNNYAGNWHSFKKRVRYNAPREMLFLSNIVTYSGYPLTNRFQYGFQTISFTFESWNDLPEVKSINRRKKVEAFFA